jgi:YtkA-like protein
MKRVSVLGGALLAGVLAAACGSGEPSSTTAPATQGPAASSQAPAGNVDVTLTTQPDPPKTGETTFEAMVMSGGQPVTDADVSVELYMAAMPDIKMPEMRNTVTLHHEGGGRYRGTGNVMMAGNWDATVRVKRNNQEIGAQKVPITAK